MKNILFCIAFWSAITALKAQNYPVSEMNLLWQKTANAVVREFSTEFIQQDMQNGVYKVRKVITVMNAQGDEFSNFHYYEDNFDELKSFSGEVYNAQGKQVRKIARKELQSTALSSNLATDGKHTFYELYYPVYPYTVKYSYEIKYKNGILMYPTFVPVPGFGVAVEKADFSLQLPADYVLREKKLNTGIETTKTIVKQNAVYQWSFRDWKPLYREPFAPPAFELLPVVYLSPDKFCVEKYCGSMENWETFGHWSADLLQGRDVLPSKIVEKVKELTGGLSEPRDKVKALYEYLQQTTHYVSIQLGIGGWQPMKAEEVARTGFGDCKALSNYMRALLKIAGIPSYYTVISTTKERFFPDYPNFTQANHVILMTPLDNDTVWLECTSQSLPFGYIHHSIAGHDALAVGDDKAFFCTLPKYPSSMNREINIIDGTISADGHAELDVHSRYETAAFEPMYYRLKGLNAKEENDVLGGLLTVQKPRVTNYRKEESLGKYPVLDIYYTVTGEEYASKTASRLFFALNPARTVLKNRWPGNERKLAIVISSGTYQTDTIRFRLPEGYAVETKLKSEEIRSKYGLFSCEAEIKDGRLIYRQDLQLFSGRYDASEYGEIKAFYNEIENLQSAKIGLVRN